MQSWYVSWCRGNNYNWCFCQGPVAGIMRLYKNIISYWKVALDGATNCLLMLSCSWESYKTFVVITWLQSPWCGTFIKGTEGIKTLYFLKQGLWYEIQSPHFLQNNELTETIINVYLNMVITFLTLQITMYLFSLNKKLRTPLKYRRWLINLVGFFFFFKFSLEVKTENAIYCIILNNR